MALVGSGTAVHRIIAERVLLGSFELPHDARGVDAEPCHLKV